MAVVLGAQEAIAKGEAKPLVNHVFEVANGVMGRANDPRPQPMMGKQGGRPRGLIPAHTAMVVRTFIRRLRRGSAAQIVSRPLGNLLQLVADGWHRASKPAYLLFHCQIFRQRRRRRWFYESHVYF